MPKLLDMEQTNLVGPGNYSFSAIRPEHLGATEYTVVSLVLDISGSVASFADELLKTQKAIVDACKKSPRADNLLLRVVHFNSSINEVHGFKALADIDLGSYGTIHPDSMTALIDAADTSIQATLEYAKDLSKNDYDVNAAIYIVTDGMDNVSKRTANSIKQRILESQKSEDLESLIVVLVGITGGDSKVQQYLDHFQSGVGITQYVDMGEATPQKLAKLANFVSKSISSQSSALGSGSASVPLQF